MVSTLLIPAVLAFFPALMALSASMDLLTMTIPNRICAILVLGYFTLAATLRMPTEAIVLDLSCGLGILAIVFVMFSLGWIGGGDAKLAPAAALWVGWRSVFLFWCTAGLFGGFLTLVAFCGRSVPRSS